MSHTPCVFTDSDWAGCIRTRESTSGRVLMMQGGAVMWHTERQRSIALSSAEAELVALSESCRDARFIRRLHASIGSAILNPTPTYVDKVPPSRGLDARQSGAPRGISQPGIFESVIGRKPGRFSHCESTPRANSPACSPRRSRTQHSHTCAALSWVHGVQRSTVSWQLRLHGLALCEK